MKPHRIKAVVLRHTYEARRNMDRVTDMVYWPVLDIIVWGFFTIYLGRGNHLQPGLVSFMLGAVILWGLFFAFQRDMAVGFLDELWSRNLVNLFSTPLSVAEYMTGLIAVNVVKAMVGMTVAALIADRKSVV
jgi:ABC-2 type transport system permease protein